MTKTMQKANFKLKDFIFDVPEEKIAQFPLENRDECKLLVLDKETGDLGHHVFSDIIDFLNPGDALVVNETKVLSARIFAHKEKTEGQIEILLLRQLNGDIWEALVKPARKVRIGNRLKITDTVSIEVIDNTESGGRVIEFAGSENILDLIEEIGQTPLPPYIKRETNKADKENYQTVYAKDIGAVAAPTAGLHFTKDLLKKIEEKGIEIIPVTLHVGLGTFRPVQVDDITKHQMHAEFYRLSRESAEKINAVKERQNKIFAVGTTVVRVLETLSNFDERVLAGEGWTDKYIYPPYNFKIVDNLITNFHVPASSLIVLVSALGGHDHIMKAYDFALSDGYRFFSYGDAMLIK